MAEGGQHKGHGLPGTGAQSSGLIQNQHGVVPHISLRMKPGFLGDSDQGLCLWEPSMELSHPAEHFKKDGRPGRFQQCLFQLAVHPLAGQPGQIQPAAKGNGFFCCRKSEPRRKLRRPQHPQRILCKGAAIYVTQNPVFQVRPPTKMIHNFAGEHVLHQGVYGKVSPSGCFFRTQKGIHKGRKIPLPSAGCLILPGHRDVKIIMLQPIDAEAGPHCRSLAQTVQNDLQRFRCYAVDFNIHILILPAQQPIPHQAPHIVNTAALGSNLLGNDFSQIYILVLHIRHLLSVYP